MLVGREAEQRRIDEIVAGARLGRSGVLMLVGEAGIGKTTLLQDAAQRAHGARLLRASGQAAEADVPFGGLAQLLRPTATDLAGLPSPQARALGVALALTDGPGSGRLAVGAAVLTLLTRYSEDRPLGILIDDAHLMDQPSAEALAFACRRFLADAVFVIATARAGEPGGLAWAGLPVLRLGGLDEQAVAALARAEGHLSDPTSIAQLCRGTGGNPLAVLALARDASRTLSFEPDSPVAIPQVLSEWFGRQVDSLPPHARTVLLVAAVAGTELPVIVRACAALGIEPAAVGEAERAGLVDVGTDRLEIVHPLIRASIYARAFPDERRRVHLAVADAVPSGQRDRGIWHRSQAALGPDPAVAAALDDMGARASDQRGHAVAATAYERAAGLSVSDADRAQRLLRAAEEAWRAGDGERAESLVAPALALEPARWAQADALALLGDIALRRGAPEAAQRLFLRAADMAGDDSARALLLMAEAVVAAFFQGDADAAVATAERLERLLPRCEGTTATAVATLAIGMARVLAGRSGVDEVRTGVALLGEDTAGHEGAGPAWLMVGPLLLRESGTGRPLVRAALADVRARSDLGRLPITLFLIARDAATTDHWAAAAADFGEAVSLARELGHVTDLAMALAGMSWLEARTGRRPECRAHAKEALSLCRDGPINMPRVWSEFAIGESALADGDIPAAVAALTDLCGFLTAIGLRDPDLSPAPELAEALLRQGRDHEARALVEEFSEAAAAKGQSWSNARAARLRGLLAPEDEVDGAFAAAMQLHGRTPDSFEAARTSLLHGARLLRARRRADARAPLRAALDGFERLGARPWAETAAAELRATGERVARRAATDAERLTPRELQIALLLTEGRTTREAAASLFVSPKTVEYHIRHIYTKLDIASRAELVARLRSHAD